MTPMPAPARYVHVRNAVTYLSVLAGLLAVMAAGRTRSLALPGALIAASVIADSVDGAFARLFRRSDRDAEFGVQLDSFVDAFAFGVVPVVAWTNALAAPGPGVLVAWAAGALVYLVAAITRLISYNLHHHESAHFVGIPTPVAALICASAYALPVPAAWGALLLALCGAAMVAPVRVPRATGWKLAVFLAWPVILILVHLV